MNEWNEASRLIVEKVARGMIVSPNDRFRSICAALAEIDELTTAHTEDGETIEELRKELAELRAEILRRENAEARGLAIP